MLNQNTVSTIYHKGKLALILTLCSFFVPSSIYSQDNQAPKKKSPMVSGSVTDAEHNPIRYIDVEAYQDDHLKANGYGGNGRFIITLPSPGIYELRIAGNGYEMQLIPNIKVVDNNTDTIEVILAKAAAVVTIRNYYKELIDVNTMGPDLILTSDSEGMIPQSTIDSLQLKVFDSIHKKKKKWYQFRK